MKKVYLFFLLLFSFYANAAELTFNLTKSDEKKFDTYIEYFKDINGSYNVHNLETLSHKPFFKTQKKLQHLGLSFQYKALWARFKIDNESSSNEVRTLWFKNITYENVCVFEKDGSHIRKVQNTAILNDFYYNLTFPPHSTKEYYVKIIVNGPYLVDAKLLHIDEADILSYKNGLFFASFAAFILISIGFYFALFIGFRKRMYLYFGLHALSHILFWMAMYGVYKPFDFSLIKVISLSSSSIFIALVSFEFLNMRKNMRVIYRAIQAMIALLFGYYIFAFYLELSVFQPIIFAIFYFIIYALIVAAIIKAVLNKQKAAFYFLFAILGYMLGYNMTIGGVFATAAIPANTFTMYIGMLGTVTDVIFSSIAFIIVAKNLYMKQKKQLEEYNKSLESKVQERTHKIQEQNLLLQKLSSTDPLTQLGNRLELDKQLERVFHHDKESAYVIMIDIDFFKKINDTYGHLVGDSVLKQIARILRKSVKEQDIIGRWGGEEFLIIAKVHDDTDILSIAQRIRKNVAMDTFSEGIKLTISLGVSAKRDKSSIEEWVNRSDEALYQAKENGRNQVVFL